MRLISDIVVVFLAPLLLLAQEPSQDIDARISHAVELMDKGDTGRATAELTRIVVAAPDNADAHYHLGRAHAARNERGQAREHFLKAIDLRPGDPRPRLALAQLQVTAGEFDAALETARAIHSSRNARLMESAALMGLKRFGEARTLLEQQLEEDPSDADTLFQIRCAQYCREALRRSRGRVRSRQSAEPR